MERLVQARQLWQNYGAIKAVESGGQVAMMVPTEVLARQMIQRLKGSLGPLGINVTLLIGHMPG